jgi:hypothetical protein
MDDGKVTILGKHAEIMRAVYHRINEIHKKPLHKGQIELAKAYFLRGLRVIQSQWGRNGGKTETALYIATVASLLTDNFITMIICPELKQGKKIYWQSNRLQGYPPPQYIEETSKTEASVLFKNKSIITVEGCENYDALRGVKPNLVIYDEFQNHSEQFHLEVMAPNLLGKDASLIIFGTPPKKRSAYYVKFREELQTQIKDGDLTRGYFEFPTSVNPTIDVDELKKIRKTLIDSNNEPIWYREYEGKLMFGGEDVVFPKWDPKVHVRTHQVLLSYLEHDRTKLKWYTICDPGTSTCFAVLFICYNPFTQQIFVLDEIYEKDRARTDSRQIWERIRKKEQELYPNSQLKDWRRIYDEAAAWFHNEIAAMHRGQMLGLSPSQKNKNDEEVDISRIKMAMAQPGAFVVSDRCYWLRWEIESYITVVDKNGDAKYVETNQHLIDCCKYFMQTSGWTLMEKADEILHNGAEVMRLQTSSIENWADEAVQNSLFPGEYNDRISEYYN